MKIALSADVSTPAGGTVRPPTEVCMHVLGTARTDVRVMRAATALTGAGFKVSVVDIECESARHAEEEIRGICFKHVVMPGWFTHLRRSDPWFLVRAMFVLMRSIFLLLRTTADIYHAHDETALPSCFIAARLRRKSLIFDAHEVPSSSVQSADSQGLKALLKRRFLMIVPHCRAIITISPSIADEFHKLYRCREVRLIRNIPGYQVVPKSDRLRRHLNLDLNVRIALYQGNLQPDRGLDRLIRSASFLEHDIVVVLMGRDVEGMQSQLEALIMSEGAANRVKIIPPIPYEELLDWTSSADLGIIFYSPDYPEVQMYLPNKIFEYMMAGLPFLSSQVDAVAEVINSYDVGEILPSLAPADIGAAINAMLADRAALDRMRRNALEASRQELNWEKESQRLVQLYQGILPVGVRRRGSEKRSTTSN